MPKILLVEDIEENIDMLSRRLKRRGYEIRVARDGLQAVDMARAEAPDLILMDMNLPQLDGWEATRRIRSDPAVPRMPIIALTAHGMASDREKTLAAGCDDHHAKPVELSRLLEQIETQLKRTAE
jgi:CheY-like chemotaxis protein